LGSSVRHHRARQYGRVADAGVQIDHIVIAVRDLDDAQAQFENRYGLTTIAGGRHPGWGTANRLVPLGAAYLEMVSVVDEAEGSGSEFGRWVSTMLEGNQRFGWAVRIDNLDGTASRLGLKVADGSRRSQSGELLRWRIAGVAQAAHDSSLPFFIEWGADTPLPGRAAVVAPRGRGRAGGTDDRGRRAAAPRMVGNGVPTNPHHAGYERTVEVHRTDVGGHHRRQLRRLAVRRKVPRAPRTSLGLGACRSCRMSHPLRQPSGRPCRTRSR
jgi:hypothetical protein